MPPAAAAVAGGGGGIGGVGSAARGNLQPPLPGAAAAGQPPPQPAVPAKAAAAAAAAPAGAAAPATGDRDPVTKRWKLARALAKHGYPVEAAFAALAAAGDSLDRSVATLIAQFGQPPLTGEFAARVLASRSAAR